MQLDHSHSHSPTHSHSLTHSVARTQSSHPWSTLAHLHTLTRVFASVRHSPILPTYAPGPGEDFEFQSETRKLLDIVASSLYSDKDVFVREIVSNCSDALEKLRYLQATDQSVTDPELDLEIHITTDVR
jgi:hypothetical protein